MISGLFVIMFLASMLKGATELQKRYREQFGPRKPKPLKSEKLPAEQRYFFWDSVQNRWDSRYVICMFSLQINPR